MKFAILVLFVLSSLSSQAQNYVGEASDIKAILAKIDSFSSYYMAGNYDALAGSYTEDAKIFPSGTEIISGREAIRNKWVLPDGVTIAHHEVMPEEIIIDDHTAYDWGYYQGKTDKNGEITSWKGKYVIIWKKTDGDWKIYLDIWNRVNE